MRRFNSKRILLFCSFIVLLVVSCKNDDKEKKPEDTLVAEEKTPVAAGLTGGTLTILYTDSAEFKQFTSKIVFSFVFRSQNALTLAGWDNKEPFSIPPEIELQRNLPVDGVTYGTGTYFGNLVLLKKDVDTIKANIKGKYNYILFTPDNRVPNHIKYKITYSNTLPTTLQEAEVSAAPAADIYVNPSPPRNYN